MSQPDKPTPYVLSPQKPPPSLADSLKAWAKKHFLIPSVAAGSGVSGAWFGWQSAKGTLDADFADVVNVIVLATCGYVVYKFRKAN